MPRKPFALKLRQQNGSNHTTKENHQKNKRQLQAIQRQQASKQAQKTTKKPGRDGSLIYPGGDTAFKALLSARFCAAIWSHISDCDETFNYWEPMHYLVFGKGLQTWEYSPEYALRSYTYLLLHAAPAYLYHKVLQPNPLLIFYLIRCILGLVCSFAEVHFYKAVCREFGVHIGRICLAFQLLSAGMFISSTAFLPSTFAMYTSLAACAAWWTQKYQLAIFMTALGAILGWPFAALLGIPIAFDMLVRHKLYKTFLVWSLISGAVTLIPMIIIDSMHFGKIVIAPWNIVKYNIFGGAGPNLYGTEPFSYYLVNGFLNFNFIWVLALLSPVFLILQYLFVPAKEKMTLNLPHYVSLASLYLWLAVFMQQPHKEERFLFPVYPMVCLAGAIALDVIQKLFYRVYTTFKTVPQGTHYLDRTLWIMVATIAVTSLMGLSRMFSLYHNYHAPLDLLMELNRYPSENRIAPNAQVNVCIGKDWHRYPGSFFLPNKNWSIRFIKSEFKGILPFPYTEGESGTQKIHPHFNDRNEEVASVYFDLSKCHFLLDLDLDRETDIEPIYARQTDKWKAIKSLPFLNVQGSHRIFRAFYVPFVSENFVQYGNFSLLQTIVPNKNLKT